MKFNEYDDFHEEIEQETLKTVTLKIRELRHKVRNLKMIVEEKDREFESRIRHLEDWKLIFVTKFSIYVSLGLFLGSIVSNLLIIYLRNLLY